jgi:hypothetical protein
MSSYENEPDYTGSGRNFTVNGYRFLARCSAEAKKVFNDYARSYGIQIVDDEMKFIDERPPNPQQQARSEEPPTFETSAEIYARRRQAVAAAAGHAAPAVDVLDDAQTVYARRQSQVEAVRRGGFR